MASLAFNNAFGGDWLSQLSQYGSQPAIPSYTPAPNPFRAQVTSQPGVAPVASALTGGAAGQGDIAGALDRYTAGLGKMKTTDWINAGLGGVQTIGGLIGAFGSLGLANKQYDLQKRMMETNLTNSVMAYNTALEDKARSRAVVEGISDADSQAYIDSHKATTGK